MINAKFPGSMRPWRALKYVHFFWIYSWRVNKMPKMTQKKKAAMQFTLSRNDVVYFWNNKNQSLFVYIPNVVRSIWARMLHARVCAGRFKTDDGHLPHIPTIISTHWTASHTVTTICALCTIFAFALKPLRMAITGFDMLYVLTTVAVDQIFCFAFYFEYLLFGSLIWLRVDYNNFWIIFRNFTN